MINYPAIDPVAISVGPVDIHWYGIMYLIGFAAAWWLAPIQASRQGVLRDRREIEDLIFYAAIGVIIGGRLGYTLFYNLPHFLNDPLSLLRIWQGGMSFHGGLLGVVTACYIYARNHRLKLFQVTDLAAPLVPIGLLAGRIGNFINGELWGRSSDLPWAMVFPGAGPLPRHPSQL